MIGIEQAKRLAEDHFPKGPEAIAEKLKIKIRESPLIGCDGWVLSGPSGTVIHLNSSSSVVRRRFTLAHELGHLILGVPTVVGESFDEALKSDDSEERQVNDLAGDLLIPKSILRKSLPSAPVDATQLTKLAKKANVSELAAAIRVVNLAHEIGLDNAALIFFKKDLFQWMFSRTLKISTEEASLILTEAKRASPNLARLPNEQTEDHIIVASIIDNPYTSSTALFIQSLPDGIGKKVTNGEKRRELELFLFSGDSQFRNQLQGVLSGFRGRASTMSLDEAVIEFFEKKAARWTGANLARLRSPRGRSYILLRLAEWFER